jgi:PGF-CTERM protein
MAAIIVLAGGFLVVGAGGALAQTENITTSNTTTIVEQTAITFDNQSPTDGNRAIVVSSVNMTDGGFVTIHNESLSEGSVTESVIGVSDFLEPGHHENVTITLYEVPGRTYLSQGPEPRLRFLRNGTLVAMPHRDTNNNRNYEFLTSNGSSDGPYTENGSAIADSAFVFQPPTTVTTEVIGGDSTETTASTTIQTELPTRGETTEVVTEDPTTSRDDTVTTAMTMTTTTTASSETETETRGDAETAQTTEGNGPGFTFAVGVLALLGAGLIAVRRA